MKKLLLSMALVLSAGSIFGIDQFGIDQRMLMPASPGTAGKPAQSCVPTGYREQQSLGGAVSVGLSYAPQRVGFGSPEYQQYYDCMIKQGKQPVQQLWR